MTRLALRFLLASAALLSLAGCKPNPNNREREYLPDMYRNQAVKAQESVPFFRTGSSMLMPPAGTVARNFEPYRYKIIEGAIADKELKNPLPRTHEVLELGRKYYNINCAVCHGKVGAGDGMVTQVHREAGMPIPPSLYTEKIRKEWHDGQIYHTITLGQGNMPAYGARIEPSVRWAIVHYVRALGEAASPTPEDVEAAKSQNLNAAILDAENPYTMLPPSKGTE